jgi:chaperonin GroES|tara:strand:+ start:206 stop:496 length:291 start_codon:yes stop_codon:yes gene_type:complete
MGKIGKPLADRVLLTIEGKSESKSTGGIILNTTTATIQTAEVVETSDGYIGQNGEAINLSVKIGDKVLINNGAGQKIRLDGNDYHLVRESDLLMIL